MKQPCQQFCFKLQCRMRLTKQWQASHPCLLTEKAKVCHSLVDLDSGVVQPRYDAVLVKKLCSSKEACNRFLHVRDHSRGLRVHSAYKTVKGLRFVQAQQPANRGLQLFYLLLQVWHGLLMQPVDTCFVCQGNDNARTDSKRGVIQPLCARHRYADVP